MVYIAGAEGEVPTLSLTLDDQFPKELSVKVSSSIVVGHDTKVRLVTDPSKIEEYNTQYGKKGVMLPETNFVLKNTETDHSSRFVFRSRTARSERNQRRRA